MARLVFITFEKIVEHSVCHRQSLNIEFSKILGHVAIGEINDNDYNTLLNRPFSIFRKSEQDKFSKAIHIFPTNLAVSKKKKKKKRKLFKNIKQTRFKCLIHRYTSMCKQY